MTPDAQPIDCAGCGEPCEAWPAGGGYGHNPAPFLDEGRVCDWCNGHILFGRLLLAQGAPFDVARKLTVGKMQQRSVLEGLDALREVHACLRREVDA